MLAFHKEENLEAKESVLYKTYSFLFLEYFKELQAQQFQTRRRFEGRLDNKASASCLLKVICANHVAH